MNPVIRQTSLVTENSNLSFPKRFSRSKVLAKALAHHTVAHDDNLKTVSLVCGSNSRGRARDFVVFLERLHHGILQTSGGSSLHAAKGSAQQDEQGYSGEHDPPTCPATLRLRARWLLRTRRCSALHRVG